MVPPTSALPLIDVDVLEFPRNPENYLAEIEQSAFNPTNVIAGIRYPH
jgi:catalase